MGATKSEMQMELAQLRELVAAVHNVVETMQANVLNPATLAASTGYLARLLNVPPRLHSNGRQWFIEHRGITVQFPYDRFDQAKEYLERLNA